MSFIVSQQKNDVMALTVGTSGTFDPTVFQQVRWQCDNARCSSYGSHFVELEATQQPGRSEGDPRCRDLGLVD